MDIYLKTPGSTLIGLDRITFDDIQVAITKSTNEYLLRPDWDANLRVVELVKSVNNLDLLHEVTLVLRKKLRASQPKVVVLTLRLMEALTTNCGTNWFYALNAEPVTKELGNVARKYIAKTGPENKEVTDTVLDLIQAWGEAFLPKKKQFPNIVEIYFTLRKEGLPFKVNNQFDPTRVPIFEKPSVSDAGGVYLDSQTDAILAATLQASMDMHQPSPARRASASSSSNTNTSSSSSFPGPAQRLGSATSSGSAGGGGGGGGGAGNKSNNRRTSATNSLIESMSISMTILKELIVASTNIFDLKSNDVINEIIDQIKEYQTQIHVSIESSMDNPELLSNLFKYNDYSQNLLSIYADIKDGSLSLTEGQKVITTALNFDGENTTPDNTGGKSDNKPAATATADLLDYNSVAEVPAKPVAPAPAVVAHAQPAPVTQSNIDLDFFSAPVAKPVATTSTNAPIAAAVQAPAPVASPPAPLNKTPSGAIPRLAPPPSGKVPALAPPPKAGSTVQRSGSISIADNSNQKPVVPVQAPVQPAVPAVAPSSSSGLLDFDPFGDSKPTPTLVPTPVVAPAPAPIQPFAAFPPQQAAPNPAFPQPAAPFAAFPSQPLQPIPAPSPAAGPIPGTYPQYPPHGAYPHPPPGAYPHVQPGYPSAAPPAGYPYPPNPNPYPAAGLYPPQPAPFGFPPNPNPNPIPITQPAPSAIPPNNPTKPAQPPADNPFDLF